MAEVGDLGLRVGEVTLCGCATVGEVAGDCCCISPDGGCMCRGDVAIRGDSGGGYRAGCAGAMYGLEDIIQLCCWGGFGGGLYGGTAVAAVIGIW